MKSTLARFLSSAPRELQLKFSFFCANRAIKLMKLAFQWDAADTGNNVGAKQALYTLEGIRPIKSVSAVREAQAIVGRDVLPKTTSRSFSVVDLALSVLVNVSNQRFRPAAEAVGDVAFIAYGSSPYQQRLELEEQEKWISKHWEGDGSDYLLTQRKLLADVDAYIAHGLLIEDE